MSGYQILYRSRNIVCVGDISSINESLRLDHIICRDVCHTRQYVQCEISADVKQSSNLLRFSPKFPPPTNSRDNNPQIRHLTWKYHYHCLPAFSKCFEKTMYYKVRRFLNCNNILYKDQHGFREKHSTSHPIMYLLNQCVSSICCDLSKTFDVIKTDTLLNKLNYYDIRIITNQWFVSNFVNRKQYVEISKTKSDVESINCGVLQGSIPCCI